MDLETVLDVIGWSGLPLWARLISAAYALAMIGYGNVGVVRNLVNGTLATVRAALAAGSRLAAWWRRPSKRELELRVLNAQMTVLTNALLGSPTTDQRA